MKDILKTSWQTMRTFLPLSLILVLFTVGALAGAATAVDAPSPPSNIEGMPGEVTGPEPYAGAESYSLQDIIKILGQIRDFILVVGIIFIVIMIVWAGISYVMAGGSEEGTEAAKGKLIGALIGAAIILGAFALIATVSNLIESRSLLGGEGQGPIQQQP